MPHELPTPYEFTPEELAIFESFESEGEFGPLTLKLFADWVEKSDPDPEAGTELAVNTKVIQTIRKAKLLQKCGLYKEAWLAADDAYEMIRNHVENPAPNAPVTPEQRVLGNEAIALLEGLEKIEGLL